MPVTGSCDLYGAIDNGTTPILFTYDNIPWPLCSHSSDTDPTLHPTQRSITSKLHPDLAAIWTAMFQFSTLINAASYNAGPSITEEYFLQSMTAILYRLLLRKYPRGSLNEAIRLSLLAFASPVFLHWNRVELAAEYFTFAYRDTLAELDLEANKVEPNELVWLLMVAAVSMSHESHSIAWLTPWLKESLAACKVKRWLSPWLRESLGTCGIATWEDVKGMLDEVLWIDILFDRLGKNVFNATFSGGAVSELPL